MSILNVGARALQANQTVLQVTGNNIANVNTQGYSRQSAVLQTVNGQYTGSGYIGKGVDVTTIERNYSEFLTRQSTLAGSISAGDTKRADQLKQLESILPGGTSGLGASVSDMLNAFADVANAPTDLTARTVALTRVSETASRLRSAATSIDDLRRGVVQELTQKVTAINSLSANIAAINDKIARAQNSGQPPNDLLDQRDRLVTQLNVFVQTSQVPATDGTVSVFLADGQPLVQGSSVSELKITSDTFNDPQKNKLALTRSGQTVILDESRLGGGEVSGLLRFQNTDLNEGRNLLGRYALAVSTSMNDQHKLGLDLDGNVGGNLFTPTPFGAANVLKPGAPATLNTGTANLNLAISDVTKFAASDYEVSFTSDKAGSITRQSDGVVTSFTAVPITLDGLTLSVNTGSTGTDTVKAGDRFLIKPYSNSAINISAEFSTPRALAVASPIAGAMGTNNAGSLQLSNLSARSNPPVNVPVTLTFTGPNSYTRSDMPGQTYTYTVPAPDTTQTTVPSFTTTTSALSGNPTFAVSNLSVTDKTKITGHAYAIDITDAPGAIAPPHAAGDPWLVTYSVTDTTSNTSLGTFTASLADPTLPVTVPITGVPGISLNLTGDVRVGSHVAVTPTSDIAPTPTYPTAEAPFTVTATPLAGNPAFTVDKLAITDQAKVTGDTYTVEITNAPGGIAPPHAAGDPWVVTYSVTNATSGASLGTFTANLSDPTLPVSIPITNVPGITLNMTGDVRVGSKVTVKPTPYVAPTQSTPTYPTAAAPFTVTATPLSGNPAFAVNNLVIKDTTLDPTKIGPYTINVTAIDPPHTLNAPWQVTYNVTDSTGAVSTKTDPIPDPTLPVSIPLTGIPGISLNLTGDVRIGSIVTITPTTYVPPTTPAGITKTGVMPTPSYTYTSGQVIESTITPKYPSPAAPFTVTPTALPGNPLVSVDNLAITDQTKLTDHTYTVAIANDTGAITPPKVVGDPWIITYSVMDTTSKTSLGTFTAKVKDPTLPVSFTVTDIPGITLDVTGDVRIGSSVTITPTPYTAPKLTGWSLTLQGTPKAGDTFTVGAQPTAYRNLNAGNASALMNLRDVAMFDGSALTDGYASLISQVGIRTQSANYSADVSNTIAANLEKDRTSVSGVNLDEEAAKLLQYQQAYQASAKVIQIAQGIFDTLMQSFR